MARRKRYSAEFKRQALRRADEPGMTDVLVCEELGMSARQLRRWREAIQQHGEEDAFPGQGKARDQEMVLLITCRTTMAARWRARSKRSGSAEHLLSKSLRSGNPRC